MYRTFEHYVVVDGVRDGVDLLPYREVGRSLRQPLGPAGDVYPRSRRLHMVSAKRVQGNVEPVAARSSALLSGSQSRR